MPYAKKRQSIFGWFLSAVNFNFDNKWHEKIKKSLFQNSIIDDNNYKKNNKRK